LPEIRLFSEIHHHFPEALWRTKVSGEECDIFIPSKSLAIEYDGRFWHKNSLLRDLEKQRVLKMAGVDLLRVREKPLPLLAARDISVGKDESPEILCGIVLRVLGKISDNYQLVNNQEFLTLRSGLRFRSRTHPSLSEYPELSAEWSKRNEPLDPNSFSTGCSQQVWWHCKKCGFEWQARICNRVEGSNCPKCRIGSNALMVKFPKLAVLWDHENNVALTLEMMTAFSNKKVWWVCSKGHRWLSQVGNMARYGSDPRCRFCDPFRSRIDSPLSRKAKTAVLNDGGVTT
jgi:hypothetical protein